MEQASTSVVELVKPRRESGMLGRLRRRWHSLTGRAGEETLFIVRETHEGDPQLQKFHPETEEAPRRCTLARVATAPRPLESTFAAIHSDASSHSWDLILRGSWAVEDPRRFLREHALEATTLQTPLSGEAVLSWAERNLRREVADAVQEHAIEDLRGNNRLPARWWQKSLREWLEPFGLTASVEEVSWESAEASRAELERQRAEELERLERQREGERRARIQEEETRTRYEAERRKLESDQRASAAEREHRLRLLEEQHRREVLTSGAAAEEARWAHEQAALRHQVEMARLRNDLVSAQAVEGLRARAELRHQAAAEHLAQAGSAIDQLASLGDPLLAELVDPDPRISHQAAERITSPEFGIPAAALNAMGYEVDSQAFITRLSQQRELSRHEVVLRMAELRGRDIGTQQRRVDTLPIGGSLQFEMTSTLAGYVTLVNIGTSGKVWLQVPNPFALPDAARVEAGQLYTVPGPQLLPAQSIEGYFELGPAGWEHMAVTITDVPLVDPRFMELATPESPFIDLTSEAAAELAEALESAEPDQYAVGLLSFLVE